MDTQRFLWAMLFVFSLIMLWDGWGKEQHGAANATVVASQQQANAAGSNAVNTPVPQVGTLNSDNTRPSGNAARVKVITDLLQAEISAEGGSLVRLELLKHKAAGDNNGNFVLLDPSHDYLAESGLIGNGLANHRSSFQLPLGDVQLAEGKDEVQVRLQGPADGGVAVDKVYTFHRNSYVVDVAYEIRNGSTVAIAPHAYFQLVRDNRDSEETSGVGNRAFTGPALYTESNKYEKFEFSEIDKGIKYPQRAQDGWVAMVQHYFVAAWLPKAGQEREYFIRKLNDKHYAAGAIVTMPSIAPGATASVSVPLYTGPQDQKSLKTLAPGLDLVANYGWVTVIALPLFWVLDLLQSLIGNWGWTIIAVTVLIKLVFFPLSAASYRSMAKMRVVTPKLQRLKEQFGHDKAKLNQEMMDLYRKEKINPLGGCLPILVQIPVFIALYSVLMGAVEIRHAPWVMWITDLSAKDPYFVLPLIMGVTMLVQTKLNPTPPDPVQAKVMMIMPIVFTGMFLFFPSGLVLYWVVNNLLSIAQQWHITRLAESGEQLAKN